MSRESFKNYTCSLPKPYHEHSGSEILKENIWAYIKSDDQTRCFKASEYSIQSRYFNLNAHQVPHPSTPMIRTNRRNPQLISFKEGAYLLNPQELIAVLEHIVTRERNDETSS